MARLLPPDVSFERQRLTDGWAYMFRHRTLGALGRILLQDVDGGHCHISCEVVGDPADPMTARRAAIFEPISRDIARQMEAATGPAPESFTAPKVPQDPTEVIESKVIPCPRCGAAAAMLVFAPAATDVGRFEDYARMMYPEYTRWNVPTWIIGPALGSGPPQDRPADIVKVWPVRESTQRLPPDRFNPLLDQIIAGHCR